MLNLTTFKEIIYPILDLIIKITIGIIIAIYLHRRTNRDKIKELLINTYMEYLNKLESFSYLQINNYMINFYKKLKNWANKYLSDKKVLSQFIKELDNILQKEQSKYSDDYFQEKANFTPYTYKFCFLIGKKYYFKKILPSEKEMSKFLLDNNRSNQIAEEVIKNEVIQKYLSQIDQANMDEILLNIKNEVTKQISQKHVEDNKRFMNSYSVKLAEAIDKI